MNTNPVALQQCADDATPNIKLVVTMDIVIDYKYYMIIVVSIISIT